MTVAQVDNAVDEVLEVAVQIGDAGAEVLELVGHVGVFLAVVARNVLDADRFAELISFGLGVGQVAGDDLEEGNLEKDGHVLLRLLSFCLIDIQVKT